MISRLCLFGLQLEGNYFLLVSAAVSGEQVPPRITRPRHGSWAPHSLAGTCNPTCHGARCTQVPLSQVLSLVPLLMMPSALALLFGISSHSPTAAAFGGSAAKSRSIWNARRWDNFTGRHLCLLFLHLLAQQTHSADFIPLCVPFFPVLGLFWHMLWPG